MIIGFKANGEIIIPFDKLSRSEYPRLEIDFTLQPIEYIFKYFEDECVMSCCGWQGLNFSQENTARLLQDHARHKINIELEKTIVQLSSLHPNYLTSSGVLKVSLRKKELVQLLRYIQLMISNVETEQVVID